jgi:uncharacterized membrane protein YoaK (UPF0700 family)
MHRSFWRRKRPIRVPSNTAGQGQSNGDSDAARKLSLTLAALLAFAAGGTDVITFSRLGDVFAGVMTGNLVLLGLSIGSGKAVVIGRAGLAIVSFILGVLLAGRITRTAPDSTIWPRQVTRVLLVESGILAVLVVGWEVVGPSPEGSSQALLLVASAVAMGLQSGAVVGIGISGLSTTYLTGTLTSVMTTLAHSGRLRTPSVVIVASLLLGAVIMGVLITFAARLAPILPFVAVASVASVAIRDGRLHVHDG